MTKYLRFLGFEVRDRVTGFAGVCTSISFDLYGCVIALITPKTNEKGEPGDGRWFDEKRLVATSEAPVMELPTFDFVPGPESKPGYTSLPPR